MLGGESSILLLVSNYFQAQNHFEVLHFKIILGGLFVNYKIDSNINNSTSSLESQECTLIICSYVKIFIFSTKMYQVSTEFFVGYSFLPVAAVLVGPLYVLELVFGARYAPFFAFVIRVFLGAAKRFRGCQKKKVA